MPSGAEILQELRRPHGSRRHPGDSASLPAAGSAGGSTPSAARLSAPSNGAGLSSRATASVPGRSPAGVLRQRAGGRDAGPPRAAECDAQPALAYPEPCLHGRVGGFQPHADVLRGLKAAHPDQVEDYILAGTLKTTPPIDLIE